MKGFLKQMALALACLAATRVCGAAPAGGSTMRDAVAGQAGFEKQLEAIGLRRESWLEKAKQATPALFSTAKKPIAVVQVRQDPAAFQGWRVAETLPVASIYNKPLLSGEGFILDFGEHLTGYFSFSLRHFENPVDAPVRLRFVFGETLAEVAEPFDPYTGSLPRSWLQDETVNIDEIPQTVSLPRRYASRND